MSERTTKAPPEAFPPELPPTRRYTLANEPTFEGQVKQDLSRLSADVEISLTLHARALLLTGRFARGEGSVISKTGEAHAFPGYACLALVERPSPAAQQVFAELAQTWTGHLRTRIEIKTLPLSTLPEIPRSLGWLDIARGNVEVLSGDPEVLTRLPDMQEEQLDRDEAGWLLTEQSAYLALALETAAEPTALTAPVPLANVDALAYRIHIMALACGDAQQLLAGQFGGNMQARLTLLKQLNAPAEHWELYEDAIHFLTRPDLWKPSGPLEQWKSQTLHTLSAWHLRLEAQRVGSPLDLHQFARYRRDLFQPPVHRESRRWYRRIIKPPRRPLSFPYVGDDRERLARASVALAYGSEQPALQRMARRLLDEPQLAVTTRKAGPTSPRTPTPAEQLGTLLRRTRRKYRRDPLDESFYF